jgi:Flp pilus assembly protein TadD
MGEENPLDFFNEDFTLFIEAGFIAVKQLDEIAARRLFKAAEVLRPESSAPKLGLGYIELNKMRPQEASRIFEALLKIEPNHSLAKALLGVSYLMSKDKKKQGELLINEAKKESDDPTIQNLAEVSLQWMQKDVKSSFSTPFTPALD